MRMTDADLIWTPAYSELPEAGNIRVERHGSGWHRDLGDMWMPVASAFNDGMDTKNDPIKQLLSMFILFNTVTVRDGIAVSAAHQAFLKIDEYREAISPDAPGASRATT